MLLEIYHSSILAYKWQFNESGYHWQFVTATKSRKLSLLYRISVNLNNLAERPMQTCICYATVHNEVHCKAVGALCLWKMNPWIIKLSKFPDLSISRTHIVYCQICMISLMLYSIQCMVASDLESYLSPAFWHEGSCQGLSRIAISYVIYLR